MSVANQSIPKIVRISMPGSIFFKKLQMKGEKGNSIEGMYEEGNRRARHSEANCWCPHPLPHILLVIPSLCYWCSSSDPHLFILLLIQEQYAFRVYLPDQ